MTKATLQAIVYSPILVLFIYLLFFYNKQTNIEKNKDIINKTNINNLEITNKKVMDNNIKQINLDDFKKEIQKEDTILIDIRTPMEWSKYGVIPNIDKYIIFGSPNFEEEIIKLDKTKKYLLYCFHGNRSDVARDYMKKLGFIRVKDLAGGINTWINTGNKVGIKDDNN